MQSTDISSARSDPSHVSGAMEATLGHHDVRSLVASEQAAQPKRYSTASLSHCKFNATKDAIPKLAAFSLQLTWAANATIVLRDLTCMGWDGNVSSRSTTTVENISIFDCRRQMKLASSTLDDRLPDPTRGDSHRPRCPPLRWRSLDSPCWQEKPATQRPELEKQKRIGKGCLRYPRMEPAAMIRHCTPKMKMLRNTGRK
jgi:hypothetical protein